MTEPTQLAYLGVFSDKITIRLCDLAEDYIGRRAEQRKYPRTVSFLIAECFQNVVRHGLADERKTMTDDKDFFQLDIVDDLVVICSANLIAKDHTEELKQKIDDVNRMDKMELTEKYKRVLFSGKLSEKGGAGLGLVEMARKSGLPLARHFESVNETFDRIFISLEIPKEDRPQRTSEIGEAVEAYRHWSEQDVILHYSGDFSDASTAYLVEMLHTNFTLQSGDQQDASKDIMTIVEVLQNVAKHGLVLREERPGVLTMIDKENALHLECSNPVDERHHDILKRRLERIKAGRDEEIASWYRERLLSEEPDEDGNNGLGLFEIARNTHNRFGYKLEEPSPGNFRFTIEVPFQK